MARIWSMRFNSDGFNHAYAGLDTDEEKAHFVTGFYRGTNGVPLKDGQPAPMVTGHAFGLKMREDAEASLALAAINGAKKGKGKGTQKAPSREPEGSLEGASMEPGGLGSGSLEGPGLRFKDPFQEGTSYLVGTSTPPQAPAKKKPRSEDKPTPKLESILGPADSVDARLYWKLVGIFGSNKNPAPTQTAQAFVDAICKNDVVAILAKAQNLRDSLSGPQYMPQLLKWLEGQGYLNPDATPAKGGAEKPRGAVTDSWTKEYESGRAHAS